MLVSIFSDASYDHEQFVGGWGAWVKSDRGMKTGGGPFMVYPRDVQEAEGFALVNAIHFAFKSGIAQPRDRIVVGVDNTSVLQIARREKDPTYRWQHIVLRHLDQFIHVRDVSFDFRHVKGHAERRGGRNYVNGICDRLAKEGLRLARQRNEASPGMGGP